MGVGVSWTCELYGVSSNQAGISPAFRVPAAWPKLRLRLPVFAEHLNSA